MCWASDVRHYWGKAGVLIAAGFGSKELGRQMMGAWQQREANNARVGLGSSRKQAGMRFRHLLRISSIYRIAL